MTDRISQIIVECTREFHWIRGLNISPPTRMSVRLAQFSITITCRFLKSEEVHYLTFFARLGRKDSSSCLIFSWRKEFLDTFIDGFWGELRHL